MITKEQPLNLVAMADANRSADLRRERLNKIRAFDTTPEQQEALQWARVDFASAAVRAFRERVRVFSALGTGSLETGRGGEASAPVLAVVQGARP